ncbi:N,N'-diacetylbacillosaminyl-diphospho-undecaprenol alpha-1,3-N-acetylgalactosaminyltransferase [Polaribacter huanghezhanensis]|nr:N,N'-diacetylbacillosaminyl-diphospho-undecaprenol alpha-1,3-N-acetylgalactosaminyltransferase [Polaribacter huanghezhanensis]
MKVLFVVDFETSINIIKTQLELILQLKRKKDVVPFVLGKISDETKRILTSENIKYKILFPTKKIDFNYIKEIKGLLKDENFDVVQFFNGKPARSFLFAVKNHKPKTVLFMGSISLHWHDPSAYLTFLSPKMDKITCNSKYVFEHVKKQLLSKNKSKAVLVYEGYSSSWFKDVKAFDYTTLNIPKDAIKVCFVGNHRKVKGTKYFLESSYHLNSTKEIHYILIGNKTNIPSLYKIAKSSPNVTKIHFLGLRNDAVSLIKGADIYAQTSLSEGFGRAISEAMCVEKPIVMTNAGGCTELIDESCGIVVPLKDGEAIGKAISTLANNDTLRIEMGKNAKIRIDTVINTEKTTEETYQVYAGLLKD